MRKETISQLVCLIRGWIHEVMKREGMKLKSLPYLNKNLGKGGNKKREEFL